MKHGFVGFVISHGVYASYLALGTSWNGLDRISFFEMRRRSRKGDEMAMPYVPAQAE